MRCDGPLWRVIGGLGVVVVLTAAAGLSLAAPGCAGSGEKFRPAFADEGEAVIYVFRLGGPHMGGPLEVVIDQEPVLSLGRGEYFAYGVQPGEHLIRVEGSAARVRLAAGESAFVEVVTGALGSNPDLEVRQEEEGRLLIEGTREAAAVR